MNRSLSSGLLTAAALIAASLTSSEPALSQTPAPSASVAPPAASAPLPAASASAAPASSAPAPATTVSASAAANAGPSSVVGTGIPKLRKQAPPPPAPTPAQLKAFSLLQQEARDYEAGSKDFRRNLTMIVRHHYEQRRKRVLTALDREITEEKHGLDDARQEAIARLERFVERYSGENADPRSTPDAMFRLGALYEERARSDNDADLTTALEPALSMYRRLIKEFPHYEEIAAVHYYLGHGYTDAGRIEEGQQAWRSLVCSNRYTVKDDAKDARKIALDPL
ncbi:MAG TPA: tetratricopeptide repeat protein, partial [Polyangiaceae bacterium]